MLKSSNAPSFSASVNFSKSTRGQRRKRSSKGLSREGLGDSLEKQVFLEHAFRTPPISENGRIARQQRFADFMPIGDAVYNRKEDAIQAAKSLVTLGILTGVCPNNPQTTPCLRLSEARETIFSILKQFYNTTNRYGATEECSELSEIYRKVDSVLVSLVSNDEVPRPTHPFLEKVKRVERMEGVDEALDVIYEKFDELMYHGKLPELEELFRIAHDTIDELSADLIIGLLSASLPVSAEVNNRMRFYSIAEDAIRRQNEWEECLLSGLE